MDTSLRRLADLTDYLVDGQVGIIKFVSELQRFPGTPDFYHYFADVSNTRAFCEFDNFNNAGGASTSREIALAKSIGEAVERYCSAIYDIEDCPLSSYEDAPFKCVNPADYALYSDEQYESPGCHWVPFTSSTPVRWTEAYDPLADEHVHVPAATIYMPYFYYQGTGDSPILQPISTGMACHCSPAEAAESGICEVIERDALMIFWQAMLNPPQISVETLSDENYDKVRRFEKLGGSVTLLNITTDIGIHCVLSVLKSPSEELPARVFAASASLDPEEAVGKALEELAHTRRYCHAIKSWMPRIEPNPPEHDNVLDQMDHLNFWADHKNAHLADFAFTSDKRIDFDDLENFDTGDAKQNTDFLCRRMKEHGYRVLIADLTTPDIRDLGLSVVHAVIPGFHPLCMGFSNRSKGGKRLWEVPQKLGYKGIAPETGDNPSPHFYP